MHLQILEAAKALLDPPHPSSTSMGGRRVKREEGEEGEEEGGDGRQGQDQGHLGQDEEGGEPGPCEDMCRWQGGWGAGGCNGLITVRVCLKAWHLCLSRYVCLCTRRQWILARTPCLHRLCLFETAVTLREVGKLSVQHKAYCSALVEVGLWGMRGTCVCR